MTKAGEYLANEVQKAIKAHEKQLAAQILPEFADRVLKTLSALWQDQ